MDGACSRHLACMHADDDDDAVAWPGRPAVGVRGSGPPSEPEAAVGLTVLSTAPLHRCIIQSFIVGPGGPASPCARTSPPVPAPGPAPCCCRSGRRPADTAPGEAMRRAGRPVTMHAGRHATPNGSAGATHMQDSAATACMPCFVMRSQGAGSPIFGTDARVRRRPCLASSRADESMRLVRGLCARWMELLVLDLGRIKQHI